MKNASEKLQDIVNELNDDIENNSWAEVTRTAGKVVARLTEDVIPQVETMEKFMRDSVKRPASEVLR